MLFMTDYRVELDNYHGPLDLLLYLIRRDEIDIHDIPVAHITEQYLRYLQTLQRLDIELAGEFMVMAATLMELKTAMMLPREERAAIEGQEADAAAGADPRFELVQQLLAYKRFKDAAYALERRREEFAARFPRRPGRVDLPASAEPHLDLQDASIWDLCESFAALMEQVGDTRKFHQVTVDDTPIELHQADILDRLQRDGAMTLQAMFAGRGNVTEMIGLFLATLELIRQRRVRAAQHAAGGPIQLELLPPESEPDGESPSRSYDPAQADNFDWPDEETRRRYLRRQERRARGEFIEEDAELEADLRAIEAEESAPALVVAPEPQAQADVVSPDPKPD
jgi:segregation and condensation protein A